MAPPAIRVAVASRQSVFVLRNVSVGLSGARVENLDHWLRVLSSDGIYPEEDFEWIVAGLLPCPRSFFKLVYSKHGELHVIFTAREASIANHSRGPWLGYCCMCSSPFSERHSRIPDGYVYPPWVVEERRFRICVVCYDIKAYIDICRDAPNLNRYEQVYLDRIWLFNDVADFGDF